MKSSTIATALIVATSACGNGDSASGGAPDLDAVAFTQATLWDGTGSAPIEDATLLVRDGWITAVGPSGSVEVPEGIRVVSLAGLFVTPGLINTHGHVGGTMVSRPDLSPGEIVEAELERYARFGITLVNSLGGGGAASAARRFALNPALDGSPRARLLMAGEVVAGSTDEALAAADRNVALGVDYLKIRVDDNLGTTDKMFPQTYRAVIDRAHAMDLRLAAHLFYLEDAKGLLNAGADLIAHSIRDQAVDAEVIQDFLDHDVCLVPTLTREVSTFVYAERPDFLDDPFLTTDVDSVQIATLEEPARQAQIAASASSAAYQTALVVAQSNLKSLSDSGVRIAFGTDTGPLGRFQGYFEHMELALMVEAGLTPEQALLSATRDAARCLGLETVGTLEPGKWADLVAFERSPLDGIENSVTRTRVFVGGREVLIFE